MEAGLLERALVCHAVSDKPLSLVQACIVKVNPINYFKSTIKSKSKFHFAMGQDTVMGSIMLFTAPKLASRTGFDWTLNYEYLESYSSTGMTGLC